MPSFNKVILMGNLTRDPELRHIQSGTALCSVGLASTRKYKQQEETVFVDVTFWGKQAELVCEYCQKGSPLLVEGRLKQDEWEDKTTGQKRSKIGVVAESMQFLGIGSKSGGQRRDNSQPQWSEPPSDDDTPF